MDYSRLQSSVDLGHGRSRPLIELIDGWAGHVIRLRAESLRDVGHDRWGPHDLVAALYLRDGVERGLSSKPTPPIVQAVDELYRSFTDVDEQHLLKLVDSSAVHLGWWWHRVPRSGQLADELRALRDDLP
jgi:hypothetical protein